MKPIPLAFLTQSESLNLLLGEFNPFMFIVMREIFGCVSAIYFIYQASPLLPPQPVLPLYHINWVFLVLLSLYYFKMLDILFSFSNYCFFNIYLNVPLLLTR